MKNGINPAKGNMKGVHMRNSAYSNIKMTRTAYGLKYERKATVDTNSRSKFASCSCYRSDRTALGRMRSTVFGSYVSVA